jgi:molybdopterin/thiamine biosynthesis adenylyltransferase
MDRDEYLRHMTARHDGILNAEEQNAISRTVACIAGVGGSGGWTAEALARLGVRRFRLADPDVFSAVNVNHQACSDMETMGRNKALALGERIAKINPSSEIRTFPEGVTNDNVMPLVNGSTVVVDGIDLFEVEIKKRLYDAAREIGVPVFSSPELAFGSALAIFDPQRSPTFERHFGKPPPKTDTAAFRQYLFGIAVGFFGFVPKVDMRAFMRCVEDGRVPCMGSACLLTGAMVSAAVVDYVLGRRTFPVAPTTVHADLMDLRMVTVGPARRRRFAQELAQALLPPGAS